MDDWIDGVSHSSPNLTTDCYEMVPVKIVILSWELTRSLTDDRDIRSSKVASKYTWDWRLTCFEENKSLVLSCFKCVLSCLVLSWDSLRCLVLTCRVFCFVLSCVALSCCVLSCLISGACVFHAQISLWDLAKKILSKRKNRPLSKIP